MVNTAAILVRIVRNQARCAPVGPGYRIAGRGWIVIDQLLPDRIDAVGSIGDVVPWDGIANIHRLTNLNGVPHGASRGYLGCGVRIIEFARQHRTAQSICANRRA